jgi:hypothetical protein
VTRESCVTAINKLRVLRGGPDSLDKLEVYIEAFQHASAEDFERGCQRAVKTRTFFPTPAELFADCETSAPRETWVADPLIKDVDAQIVHIPNPFGGKGLTLRVSKVWDYHCDDCDDIGQVSFWCGDAGPTKKPWQLVVPCGKRQEHTPHEYVTRCSCWERNPALIRKRAAQAQHARGGKSDAA